MAAQISSGTSCADRLEAKRRPGRQNAEVMRTGQALVDGYRDGTLDGSWMGCGGDLDGARFKPILPPACGAPNL